LYKDGSPITSIYYTCCLFGFTGNLTKNGSEGERKKLKKTDEIVLLKDNNVPKSDLPTKSDPVYWQVYQDYNPPKYTRWSVYLIESYAVCFMSHYIDN